MKSTYSPANVCEEADPQQLYPTGRYPFQQLGSDLPLCVQFPVCGGGRGDGTCFYGEHGAYPMAKHDFVGKKAFGSVITLLPAVYLFGHLHRAVCGVCENHWINTYMSLIAPVWSSSLGLYLMMNFMGQVPNSLLESARIDGAKEIGVWWRIVMPNVKPAWTIAILPSPAYGTAEASSLIPKTSSRCRMCSATRGFGRRHARARLRRGPGRCC